MRNRAANVARPTGEEEEWQECAYDAQRDDEASLMDGRVATLFYNRGMPPCSTCACTTYRGDLPRDGPILG